MLLGNGRNTFYATGKYGGVGHNTKTRPTIHLANPSILVVRQLSLFVTELNAKPGKKISDRAKRYCIANEILNLV